MRLFGLVMVCALVSAGPAAVPLNAQWIDDPALSATIQKGIDHIYNLEFSDAEKVFADVVRSRPEHPTGHFFQAMIQWVRILSDFNVESHDDRFIQMLDRVIEMCDRRLEKNPRDIVALFFKGGSIGFRGRLRANRGSWLLAAKDGISALPLVRKAYEIEPGNHDVLLGIGIYNYYAAVIPDAYPFVKPVMIFFPTGDRSKGIEQLELASRNARYARAEASYFLMQNHYLYEKNYIRAYELARMLHERYAKNPIFHRYLGRTSVSLGMWPEAERVFGEVAACVQRHQTGYGEHDGREAHYYLGRAAFLRGDLPTARNHYLSSVDLSARIDSREGSGFASLATLALGMIHDLQQERAEAVKYYRKVLNLKKYQNSHVDARRYLVTPYARN